jgi:hypothetical protein
MSRMPMMGIGMPTGYGPGMVESQMGMGNQMPMPPEEPMPVKKKKPTKKKTSKKGKKK